MMIDYKQLIINFLIKKEEVLEYHRYDLKELENNFINILTEFEDKYNVSSLRDSFLWAYKNGLIVQNVLGDIKWCLVDNQKLLMFNRNHKIKNILDEK